MTSARMGLLDPFWNAVDTTIAGVGSTVGGAINGVGDGISATGRNVGDGIAGAAGGYGSYVNDTANYVRDATGAGGVRAGSASNPIGLTRDKDAARSGGMPKYTPYKAPPSSTSSTKAIGAPPNPKAATGPAKNTRSIASQNAALAAKERASTAANARQLAIDKQKSMGGVTGKAPAAKGPAAGAAGGAKKPTGTVAGKGAPNTAAGAAKKTGGTVTGGKTGAVTKKPQGTVTGRPTAKK